jgi:hypothetical protein
MDAKAPRPLRFVAFPAAAGILSGRATTVGLSVQIAPTNDLKRLIWSARNGDSRHVLSFAPDSFSNRGV